jgi:predicted permease
VTLPSRLRSWLGAVLRRSRLEREMDAELRFHLEAHAADLVRAGMPAAEAVRRARLAFGAVDGAKEQCRQARGVHLLDTLAQDLRYGARHLLASPGFTAVAVLTLALGIGANTAIFSAVDALLLGALPVPDSRRLVSSWAMREGYDPFGTSALELAAYRDRSDAFARCGVARSRSWNLLGEAEPERVQGAAVQADFLAALGVHAVLGRDIGAAEDRPGGPAVALLSHGFWQRRFGGDRRVLGRSLNLDGRITTIIGVLPPGFDYPDAAEIWVPLQTRLDGLPLAAAAEHSFVLAARLRPGVSVERADARSKEIARQLEREYPQVERGWSVAVVPLRRELLADLGGRVEKSLLALLAAVGFLLLLCCANVAGLLLARGVTRGREIALRRALGAGRGRIVRQLVTESLLLASLGGLGGLLLARGMLPLLRSLSPIQALAFSATLANLRLDGRALAFLAAVTVLTGVASGLWPAIQEASSHALMGVLREGGRRAGTGKAGRRSLSALVVAEMALAVALLAGGALTLQSFQRLRRMELGFRPENLLTMHMELSPTKYRDLPQRVSFVERVLGRIESLPGVAAAGATTNIPLSSFTAYDAVFTVEGGPPVNPADVPITSHRLVSPGYLETLGVTLVKGRLLDRRDRAGAQPVAVISEELARQGWHDTDPIGKRLRRVRPGQTDPWLTVVGVVRDVKEDRGNFRVARPVWYLPYAQQANVYPIDLVVKASGDPAGLARAVRRAVLAVDPDQPVSNVITMDAQLQGLLVTERFSAILMGALAATGLLLAVIGLYGVMAYSVSRLTGEIGLRVALGAVPADIFRMVLGRGAALVLGGLLLGLSSAAALARLLAGTLYGVEANDPGTFAAISMLLALVALAACALPARRAMRVEPTVALRLE